MDPVAVGDPVTDSLKEMVKEIVSEINDKITIHDFRVVKGPTHVNMIFDVLVPFSCKIEDEEIKKRISEEVWERDATNFCVITIDRDYVNR